MLSRLLALSPKLRAEMVQYLQLKAVWEIVLFGIVGVFAAFWLMKKGWVQFIDQNSSKAAATAGGTQLVVGMILLALAVHAWAANVPILACPGGAALLGRP